jgi:hypothetical protein
MPMPSLGITRIENPSLESVNQHSSLVTKAVTNSLLVASPLVTREVTAFDTGTRVVLTASRDGFFNPCNPKAWHCYIASFFRLKAGSLFEVFPAINKRLQF